MSLIIRITSAENGYQIEVEPFGKQPVYLNASTDSEVYALIQSALSKVLPFPKRTPQELEAAAKALDKEADMAEKLMRKSNLSADERQQSELYIAANRSKAESLRKEARQA